MLVCCVEPLYIRKLKGVEGLFSRTRPFAGQSMTTYLSRNGCYIKVGQKAAAYKNGQTPKIGGTGDLLPERLVFEVNEQFIPRGHGLP